jgi:hypothetical protein
MVVLLCFFLALLTSPFKSKSRLEAENAALRHQLIVLQRKVRGRVGCAVLGWNSKPQVKDENERRYAANEWTDADKEKFKRLMSDHR